jgi:hypothetical protein
MIGASVLTHSCTSVGLVTLGHTGKNEESRESRAAQYREHAMEAWNMAAKAASHTNPDDDKQW